MKDGKVVEPAEKSSSHLQVINEPDVEDRNKMLLIEPTDFNVRVITEEEAEGVELIEYMIDNLLVEIVASKMN